MVVLTLVGCGGLLPAEGAYTYGDSGYSIQCETWNTWADAGTLGDLYVSDVSSGGFSLSARGMYGGGYVAVDFACAEDVASFTCSVAQDYSNGLRTSVDIDGTWVTTEHASLQWSRADTCIDGSSTCADFMAYETYPCENEYWGGLFLSSPS